MSGIDYSKWDNIELSDDEEDCHPNIDKDSWFRMKHRARVEREEKEQQEKDALEAGNTRDYKRIRELNGKLDKIRRFQGGDLTVLEEDPDVEFEEAEGVESEVSALRERIATRDLRLDELEKAFKWNVDNMCTVVSEKTFINKNETKDVNAGIIPLASESGKEEEEEEEEGKGEEKKEETLRAISQSKPTPTRTTTSTPTSTTTPTPTSSVEASLLSYHDFVTRYEDLLESFSETGSLDKTRDLLLRNADLLLNEHAQSYILLSCLEDEMNGKRDRMKLVGRQSQILTHITDLAASMGRDPRDMIGMFFSRLDQDQFSSVFFATVEDFLDKIRHRAVEKRREMQASGELPMSREERMGPGGLDPIEVLESLPEDIQEAFMEQDMAKLQAAFGRLDHETAVHYLRQCEDSGLWVPGKGGSAHEDEEEGNLNDIDDDDEDEEGMPPLEG
jgi:cell division cycle protein 37